MSIFGNVIQINAREGSQYADFVNCLLSYALWKLAKLFIHPIDGEVQLARFRWKTDEVFEVLEKQAYFWKAPNTDFSRAVLRATGFSRMRFSSSATIMNRPSMALPVT